MAKYYLLVTFIFCVQLFSSPSIAILTAENDSPFLSRKIKEKINPHVSSDIYSIRNTYDISKILSRKPAAIVLTSSDAAQTYLKYRPSNKAVPIVAVCNYNCYSTFEEHLPEAAFICGVTPMQELFEHLGRFTGSPTPTVGYIYPDSLKTEVLYEAYQLKEAGIEVFSLPMKDKPTLSGIVSILKKLKNKGVTVLRIAGTGEIYHLIEKEPSLREYLAQNTSVIISDKRDLYHILTGSVVVTIRPNLELLSSIAALTIQAVEKTEEPAKNLLVQSNIASLHYGKVRHFSLVEDKVQLLYELKNAPEYLAQKSSRSELWNSYFEKVLQCSDTIMTPPTKYAELLEESSDASAKAVRWFNTIKEQIAIIIISLLGFILLFKIARVVNRRNAQKPLAIIYPGNLFGKTLLNPNGRNKKLTIYLKKEQYKPLRIRSLIRYKKQFESKVKRFHFIDWEHGEDAVRFLHNIVRDLENTENELIAICNIPKKRQLEIAPRFGEFSLHLFEKFPTTEEMDSIFYGANKREPKVSYISGIITEDSLPPILQMLETNEVNGALLIEDPKPFAAIFYRKGVIVYAEDRLGTVGEKALYDVLSKRTGSFRFESDQKSPIENLSIRSMDLLMNWAGSFDSIDNE